MIRIEVTALGLSLPISILSVKISSSGKSTLLVFLSGDDLRPVALGFLYMSYDFGVKLRNAERCCAWLSGPHLVNFTGST